MRKKITAACLATCIAASMLPSLIACGAPGAKEIENGTVKELSDGGAAIVSGDYRMDCSPSAPSMRFSALFFAFRKLTSVCTYMLTHPHYPTRFS